MQRRQLMIGGMWIAALAAIAAIYLNLEPEPDTVRTQEVGDAPTFVAGEDLAEGGSRLDLEVGPDPGDLSAYRGGLRNTGRSPFRGPATARRVFVYASGGRISAQPVVGQDGTIYVGGHDHRLHAITPDGEQRWATRLHRRIWSAAAVVGETVYVGSDAEAFFALDVADGARRWRVRVEGDADGPPAVFDGTIYFTAGPHLYAVTLEGEVRWRFQARGPFLVSGPAIDSDGTIYVGSIDDYFYAIAPDGRMRWEYETGNNVSSSPVIGDDGTIYFGSDDQHVHALDRDGHLRWRAHLDGYIRAPVALGRDHDVIAAVYGPRPRLVSLDAETGEPRWFFPVSVSDSSEIGVASGPIVDVDGNIYFGAHDDFFYSVSGGGALRWIHQVGADVDSAPILREDGTLLFGSDDGNLYAIAEGPADVEPLADGGVSDAGATVEVGVAPAGGTQ